MDLSIVTPAWNEEKNLKMLYRELCYVLEKEKIDWEWVIVDDASVDLTSQEIKFLHRQDSRVRGLRFKKNYGSHRAIYAGLKHSRGDFVIVMSSDLQDPPDLINVLLKHQKKGNHDVVWATRKTNKDQAMRFFAKIYFGYIYWSSRNGSQLRMGSDYLLIKRSLIDRLVKMKKIGHDLFLEISKLAQSAEVIEYQKNQRAYGESGWTLFKKIKFVLKVFLGFKIFPKYEIDERWGF